MNTYPRDLAPLHEGRQDSRRGDRGPHAEELIHVFALAVAKGMYVQDIAE
ncbi:MAG: hypothetical protein QXK62_01955 [Thermoproteus sp.]